MNDPRLTSLPWLNKISHPAQVGGIETSVLDNGPGRGTRIAWVNTGTGLRFKIVPDRAMDIAEAFFNGHNLTWIGPLGVSAPQPAFNKGLEWLKTFGGGLLTTCGLSHAGGPDSDEYGERALHGAISNSIAEIESIVQPDPANGKLDLSITGTIKESQIFGPKLELRRKISARIGEAAIHINDVVTNTGNTPAPHMLLYHLNFGWPLVDEGTKLVWEGKWKPGGPVNEESLFREGNDYKTCPAPLDKHRGSGEDVAFIDPGTDDEGRCVCGLVNQRLSIAVKISFYKSQLPWLTNWLHFGKHDYVTGLEPGTNPPIGQARARKENSLIVLEPGESKHYDLTMEVLTRRTEIEKLLNGMHS